MNGTLVATAEGVSEGLLDGTLVGAVEGVSEGLLDGIIDRSEERR